MGNGYNNMFNMFNRVVLITNYIHKLAQTTTGAISVIRQNSVSHAAVA